MAPFRRPGENKTKSDECGAGTNDLGISIGWRAAVRFTFALKAPRLATKSDGRLLFMRATALGNSNDLAVTSIP